MYKKKKKKIVFQIFMTMNMIIDYKYDPKLRAA